MADIIYPAFNHSSDVWACECECPLFHLSRDNWIRCHECGRKSGRWHYKVCENCESDDLEFWTADDAAYVCKACGFEKG